MSEAVLCASPYLDLELEGEDSKCSRGDLPMPPLRILLLACTQVGVTFNGFLTLIVIVPSQLALIAGDARKGSAVGLVLGLSGVLSLLLAPMCGTLSDRIPWTSHLGRRAPLLLLGSVVSHHYRPLRCHLSVCRRMVGPYVTSCARMCMVAAYRALHVGLAFLTNSRVLCPGLRRSNSGLAAAGVRVCTLHTRLAQR